MVEDQFKLKHFEKAFGKPPSAMYCKLASIWINNLTLSIESKVKTNLYGMMKECPVQMIFICIVTLHDYTWILRRDQLFQDNNIIGITIEIAFTQKKNSIIMVECNFFPNNC